MKKKNVRSKQPSDKKKDFKSKRQPQRNMMPGSKRGFGLNEVIGIAAAIIIAAVVVIPGLKLFAGDVISSLDTWWQTMASSIFSSP